MIFSKSAPKFIWWPCSNQSC